MAKLQDGYAKIANKLLESVCRAELTIMQKEIILFVMRYTYGFSRKQARMSLSFIAKGIARDRSWVSRNILDLVASRVIIKSESHGITILEINNHIEEWNVIFRQSSGEPATSDSGEPATMVVANAQLADSGEPATKETQNTTKKKEEKQTHKGASRRGVSGSALFSELWGAYPKAKRDEAGKRFVTEEDVAEIEKNEAAVRAALRIYLEGVKEKKYLQKASDFFRGNWKQYAPEERSDESEGKGDDLQ